MEKPISGKMKDHKEWLYNEIAELKEAVKLFGWGSEEALMEVFDVLAFLVWDGSTISEAEMQEAICKDVHFILLSCVNRWSIWGMGNESSAIAFYTVFNKWCVRKQEKYGAQYWRDKVALIALLLEALGNNKKFVAMVYGAYRRANDIIGYQ